MIKSPRLDKGLTSCKIIKNTIDFGSKSALGLYALSAKDSSMVVRFASYATRLSDKNLASAVVEAEIVITEPTFLT